MQADISAIKSYSLDLAQTLSTQYMIYLRANNYINSTYKNYAS